jgi:quercetin dioxygenase-like cupin family protein
MNAKDRAQVRIGALELNFLLDETQGSNDLVMFEMTVPSNSRVPVPHYHKDVDEVMYGLEGTFTMTVDNDKHEIEPGDSLFVGRGRIHHFTNTSPSTARVLVVLNPGSIGRKYFEEIAQEINVPGKPDLAKVEEIMLRHGLVPA